ncbi:helix-turn-helix transcriptional regulator [Zobellella sp. DQSA1]|uniref:helix-turn-helix transcriptional regulator n=1 Tax=Zobellella sp. DQSA1 TaxID=3342386 RepID=UPI0035C1B9B4
MPKPTTRILALLELLQTHGRMTGAEMARRLDVNPRTVRRYITVLEELGIPVTTEQGRHGGYMLVAGFRLPPMMLTNEETLAVSLGLQAARHLGLAEVEPAVTSVLAKLERVMPEKLRHRLRAAGDTTNLLLPRTRNQGHLLPVLADAIQSQRRLALHYHSRKDEGLTREVDPYGLVFYYGRWYLGGFCHLRRALRSFRLDRMRDVSLLDTSFERPADFNAAEHFQESLATAWPHQPVKVLLHTNAEGAADLLHCSEATLEPCADGVLLRTSTDSLDWCARWLAGLPMPVVPLEPPELKDALRRHAEQLLDRCKTTGAG